MMITTGVAGAEGVSRRLYVGRVMKAMRRLNEVRAWYAEGLMILWGCVHAQKAAYTACRTVEQEQTAWYFKTCSCRTQAR